MDALTRASPLGYSTPTVEAAGRQGDCPPHKEGKFAEQFEISLSVNSTEWAGSTDFLS